MIKDKKEDYGDDEISEDNISDDYTKEDDIISDDIIVVDEDDEKIDIIIEVSDDIDIVNLVDDEDVVEDDIILSKHKLQGKHSLKYDSIFKGKKDDVVDDQDNTSTYFNDSFDVDRGSIFYSESHENDQYLRTKRVKERVFEVLSEKTSINFFNNRRKPSRVDFNNYYMLLSSELVNERFTNVELFNELSVYFSDNLFNMFKLLDNRWRTLIISELQDHIGKNTGSKEITNRNIFLGTELEFTHEDILNEVKLYTGVVIETDYEKSMFKIDSYENLYDINIKDITKILNNTKFKHNLNKLDNIDFL